MKIAEQATGGVYHLALRSKSGGTGSAELQWPLLSNQPFEATAAVFDAGPGSNFGRAVVTGWTVLSTGDKRAATIGVAISGGYDQPLNLLWSAIEDSEDVSGDETPLATAWQATANSEPGFVGVLCRQDTDMTGGFRVYVYDPDDGSLESTLSADSGQQVQWEPVDLAIGPRFVFVACNAPISGGRTEVKVFMFDLQNTTASPSVYTMTPGTGMNLVARAASGSDASDLLPGECAYFGVASELQNLSGQTITSDYHLAAFWSDPSSQNPTQVQLWDDATLDVDTLDNPTCIAGSLFEPSGETSAAYRFHVAGTSRASLTSQGDIVTMQHKVNEPIPGIRQLSSEWTKRHNDTSPANFPLEDVPHDIIYFHDSEDDRLVVVGTSERSSQDFDYVSLAYDVTPGASQRWIAYGFEAGATANTPLDVARSVAYSNTHYPTVGQCANGGDIYEIFVSGTSLHATNADDWMDVLSKWIECDP